MKIRSRLIPLLALALWLAACAPETTAFPAPAEDYSHLGLSDAEAASLLSLEQVDEYPLYTMHHYAEYDYAEYAAAAIGPLALTRVAGTSDEPWGCSLFAALADPEARIYGRNFDWGFSPALLLFTDPPDGFASAAIVDMAYLGFAGDNSENLVGQPLSDLAALLDAPYIPFDGLNEAGLAVGMAAVPLGEVPTDPSKETVGSLGIIRVMLDKAATVEEAVELMLSYNIDFEGGPPVHYLMADSHGDAALVEHYQGDVHVIRNETMWLEATNFLESAVDSVDGQCWRHDIISKELDANDGVLSIDGALLLLEQVAQAETQWSVVYSMSSGKIRAVMGRAYERVHTFELEMLE